MIPTMGVVASPEIFSNGSPSLSGRGRVSFHVTLLTRATQFPRIGICPSGQSIAKVDSKLPRRSVQKMRWSIFFFIK
jgi:hypothetical protein